MVDTVKENASLEMLQTALSMEEKGRSFYEKAMSECHNEYGKEIFTFLRNEEIVHVGRIKKIHASMSSGKGWSTDWKEVKARPRDLETFFKEMREHSDGNMKADTSDLDALEIGIDFENKAVDFYKGELERSDEEQEKEFIQMMIIEEKKHVEILEDMKLYMTDPEGWNSKFDSLNYAGG